MVKVEFIVNEEGGKERYAVFNTAGALIGYAGINVEGGLTGFQPSNRFTAEILNAIEKERGNDE